MYLGGQYICYILRDYHILITEWSYSLNATVFIEKGMRLKNQPFIQMAPLSLDIRTTWLGLGNKNTW